MSFINQKCLANTKEATCDTNASFIFNHSHKYHVEYFEEPELDVQFWMMKLDVLENLKFSDHWSASSGQWIFRPIWVRDPTHQWRNWMIWRGSTNSGVRDFAAQCNSGAQCCRLLSGRESVRPDLAEHETS